MSQASAGPAPAPASEAETAPALLERTTEAVMPVKISPSPDRQGEWRISIDDTYIVCFSGPAAREQALRRSRDLAELLHDTTEVSEGPGSGTGLPFRTRG